MVAPLFRCDLKGKSSEIFGYYSLQETADCMRAINEW